MKADFSQSIPRGTRSLTSEKWQASAGSGVAKGQKTAEFDRFFSLSIDLLCIAGFDGYFKHLNPVWQNTLGFSTEELLTKPFIEFIHPEDRDATLAEVQKLITEGVIISFENRYLCKDGSYKWLSWNGTVFVEEKLIYATARDISDLKHAKADLENSLALLRASFEATTDGILVIDSEGKIAHYNRNFVEMWGIDDAAIAEGKDSGAIALVLEQLKNPEQFLANLRELYSQADAQSIDLLEFKDGRIFERSSQPQRVGNKIVGRVFNFRDVTAQKWAEVELQKSLQCLSDFKFALDRSALVAITDRKGIITYVNDKFCEISKYSREELMGQDHRLINSGHHPKEFFKEMWSAIASGQVWKGEVKNKAKDGSYYWVDTTIVPLLNEGRNQVQYLAIRFDITPRKQAEEALRQSEAQLRQQATQLETTLSELKSTQMQLVQSEKMSSLGQLVAGVAHEINNPVNFIYGNLVHVNEYAENLLKLVEVYEQHSPNPVPEIATIASSIDLDFLSEDLPKLLNSMKMGAERIREIVKSLRNFSRLDESEKKAVDLHEGLDNTLLILAHRLKAKYDRPEIQVIKEYGNLPKVDCYAGPMNQVFMNILTNAIDAIEDNNGKRSAGQGSDSSRPEMKISICTEVIEGTSSVRIRIRDSGAGIKAEEINRLFDPFFTTKPVGKGTGLGLSISYQIVVNKHGGSLKCFSEVGKGAEFWIEIPIGNNF